MVAAAPFAIFFGITACMALGFFAFRDAISARVASSGSAFKTKIERADITLKPEEVVLSILGGGSIFWVATALMFRPPLVIGLLLLPVTIAFAGIGANLWLDWKAHQRMAGFAMQLELVLRMMAGALRVGLGLRQSIILVTEEVPDPARREFMRIIGRTNLGISILDALDELAVAMPSAEMAMTAKAIRVQTQTGGDLAKVLENLAGTIKDRRRVFRKMRALTAQGRGSAYIIGGLPVLVGSFVVFTQPTMGGALLHTNSGHIALGIVAGLEALAAYSLNRILQFDV
jgi:tight adherence protein B